MNNTGIKLNLKWVSEEIGKEWKQWKLGDTVKIQAQTGTGKTFFIFGNKDKKGLVDKDSGRLIYICNRTELKRHIKIDLCRKYNTDLKEYCKVDDKGNLIKNENGKNIIDTTKLDNMCSFNDGDIIITSYHAIQFAELDKIYLDKNGFNLNDFKYIVLDECQYFFTDAFNTKTYLSYNKLVKEKYHNSIKIFISATMEELDEYIDKIVDKHNKKSFGTAISKVWNYDTGRDYSYIKHIMYLRKRNDIGILIKNYYNKEINQNKKWVIFVSGKKFGEHIEEFLNNSDIKATFICANTSDKIKRDAIDIHGNLSCKVLITTKCLDNGINIMDKSVTNMAIFANDKITFIQELGRKRVDINNAQEINLIIPVSNKGIFKGLINKEQTKMDDRELYHADINAFTLKYNNYKHKVQDDIFYQEKVDENLQRWKLNPLGLKRIITDKKVHEYIFNKLEKNKLAFVKEQLSWLGLENKFDKLLVIEELVDKNEVETLEEWLKKLYENDIRLSKDEFKEQIEKIIKNKTGSNLDELLNKLDGRHKARSKGMKTYNDLFKLLELPYMVGSKPDKEYIDGKRKTVTYWLISKVS